MTSGFHVFDPTDTLPYRGSTNVLSGAKHKTMPYRDAIPRAAPLARAEFATLRLRLLKIGARVVEKATRIRIYFASAFPDAALFRRQGFGQSTHVIWLGLRSRQDWALVRRATRNGYVFVTNDRADFTSPMERHNRHPGLICMNVAHGLMSLDVQTRLFELAVAQSAGTDLTGQIVDITLTAERQITVERYVSRPVRS